MFQPSFDSDEDLFARLGEAIISECDRLNIEHCGIIDFDPASYDVWIQVESIKDESLNFWAQKVEYTSTKINVKKHLF
jgi:hypothetical protein